MNVAFKGTFHIRDRKFFGFTCNHRRAHKGQSLAKVLFAKKHPLKLACPLGKGVALIEDVPPENGIVKRHQKLFLPWASPWVIVKFGNLVEWRRVGKHTC